MKGSVSEWNRWSLSYGRGILQVVPLIQFAVLQAAYTILCEESKRERWKQRQGETEYKMHL